MLLIFFEHHSCLQFMSEKPKKILNTKTKPINKMTQPRKRSRSSTGGSSRSGRNRKRKRPHPKEKKDDTRESFTISNTLMDSIQKYKLSKFGFMSKYVAYMLQKSG